jgi:predicted lipoprotein with Yx(FWY)xxD motif
MSAFNLRTSRSLKAWASSALVTALFTGCVADEPGIKVDNGGGSSGEGAEAGAPSESLAGSASPGDAGMSSGGSGGSGAGAVDSGGTQAGNAEQPSGGTAGSDGTGGSTTPIEEGGQGGALGEAGSAGQGGSGEPPIAMSCIFHTDVTPPSGTGGAPPAANVVLQTNAFVGSYLTDAAGRTLYTYGSDLPGDCNTPPVSGCSADCLVSWPPFDAGERVLGAGLDDAAFGTIDRGDGSSQTTYYGWPLYYYKSDLTLGQMTGQGKGKTWHVAELSLPTVVIMKSGTIKYLADGGGHTLYVSSADQAGGDVKDPVSNCEGDCLKTFTPFREKRLSVVTSLEEGDFTVFVRHGAGGLQLAYKGMPLYRASTDLKSGDQTGLATPGFTAAVP